MIDHRDLEVRMEVLGDVARDFPILERVTCYQDEIWNTFARKVRFAISKLQEKYNAEAEISMNLEADYFLKGNNEQA